MKFGPIGSVLEIVKHWLEERKLLVNVKLPSLSF
jgi:hypothetical protein